MKANRLQVFGRDSIELRNAKVAIGGWSWDGSALRHPSGKTLRFGATVAAELTAAVAQARPGTTDRKTGMELSRLPEVDRAGYEFVGTRGVHGLYERRTAGVSALVEFDKVDLA